MSGGVDIHFVSNKVTEKDKDALFGPLDGDELFVEIEDHWSMANILTEAGVFKSVSQARKNGEHKPIPWGFTHITRGKKANKRQIFILNIGEPNEI